MKEKLSDQVEINIDIQTKEEDLLSHLLEKENPSKGDETELSNGIKVRYPKKQPIQKAGEEEVVRIILSRLGDIGAILVANWIWNKIKNKDVSWLRIEREVVEEEGEVKRLIKEKIEEREGSNQER